VSRRTVAAFAAALLIHAGVSCAGRVARAQEPGDCEPVSKASVETVAERYGLDPEQTAWLLARVAAGTLRSPEDLEGMPGLGPDLRRDLQGAWCWPGGASSAPSKWNGSVEAAVRVRRDAVRKEARFAVEAPGRAEARGRLRLDPGGEETLRGTVGLHRGGWSLRAGSLRLRLGLGLLAATPGAEVRGSAPLRGSAGGWRSTLATDPETLTGAAIRRDQGAWTLEAAHVRGRVALVNGDLERRGWDAVTVRREVPKGWVEGALLRLGSAWTGSVSGGGPAGPGAWSAEWSRGEGGEAAGGAWRVTTGPWRLGASLVRMGPSYAVPQIRAWRRAAAEEIASLRFDFRWQGGPARFIRTAFEEGRGPETRGASWGRRESVRLVEVGERLARGVRAGFLWKVTDRRGDGLPEDGSGRADLVRAELDVAARPWRGTLRVDERGVGGGRSRLTAFRFGRKDGVEWEVRAALAEADGDAPDLFWYRRRAGGLYGWDRPAPGSWIGAWARIPLGRWGFEASADAIEGGWETVGAVRRGWGGG
jgi:hypothetical protein